MIFCEFDDIFDFRFGSFRMSGFARPFKIGYSRTSESRVVRLLLNKALEKKDIKVRLQEGNVLEIEWPRALESVDIPID